MFLSGKIRLILFEGICRILECWRQPAQQGHETRPESCQPGAYVISGGLGSLGLQVSKWLTQSHPSKMYSAMLLGRSGRGPAAEEAAAEAMAFVTWLRVVRCDAGMQEEAAAACACNQVRHHSGLPPERKLWDFQCQDPCQAETALRL